MRDNKGNISKILEGLVKEGHKYLGDNDVVTVDSVRLSTFAEDKLNSKYEKVLSEIGTNPGFSVEIDCSDDFEDVGVSNALDSISIGIYFDSLKVDTVEAIGSLKKILKKYAWAGIRYSKKDKCFLIEVVGMFNAYEMLYSLKSDGINIDRFYRIISGSEIEDYRLNDY